MSRTPVHLVLGLVVTLLFGAVALAYNVLDPARRWLGIPRAITVDARGMASVTDADHGVNAAVTAANVWNATVINSGPIVSARPGTVVYRVDDGVSDVIFADPTGICTGSCLAATTIAYWTYDRSMLCTDHYLFAILDSDVAFNLSYSWTTVAEPDGCSGEVFLETVMTHEIGHVLGIAHSNDGNAVMYPYVSTCVNKQLYTDDVLAARSLYYCPPPSPPVGGCGGPELLGGPPKCKP